MLIVSLCSILSNKLALCLNTSSLLYWCFSKPLGPMKEKDLMPGTVFPVMGTLLFFLPERYREKLCCVTPLPNPHKVTSHLHSSVFSVC